jgi:hypothetical protein
MTFHRPAAAIRATQLFTAVLAIAAALFVGACGGDDGGGAPESITGFITEVRRDSRDQASFIKLRDRDDRVWELPIEFDPGSEVPAAHLEQHKTQLLPVVVHVREANSGLYAASIEDVPQ